MKRKLFAVITTAAMALSLVACGGVTISGVALPESMNLEKGATQQLQLEYSAEGEAAADKIAEAADKLTIEWSSSDESIVTVDADGNVTAVETGEAYVTATVKEKDGLTATTLVRVAVTPTGVEAPKTKHGCNKLNNRKNIYKGRLKSRPFLLQKHKLMQIAHVPTHKNNGITIIWKIEN